jgi:hypothetical protein
MWDDGPGYKFKRSDPVMSNAMAAARGVLSLMHAKRVRFWE